MTSPAEARAQARWAAAAVLHDRRYEGLTRREWQRTHQRAGFVYFIQRGDEYGPVKIGWAVDPERRRGELQVGNAERLTLLGKRSGTKGDERALHAHFKEQRLEGEWFRWSLNMAVELRGGTCEELTIAEAAFWVQLKSYAIARLIQKKKVDGVVRDGVQYVSTRSLSAYLGWEFDETGELRPLKSAG